MNILIEKDPSNLVAKSVTATEREAWAVDFTIYDVNADGSRGDAYGPTRTRQEEGPLYVDSLDAIRVGPDGDQRSTILTAQQVAAVAALVEPVGTVTVAALTATTGTPGQTIRIADGADAGAALVWAIPAGASAYTWCWWLWPQAAY